MENWIARLNQLQATLDPFQQLTIQPHNDPDPDAIASAVGFRFLLQQWGIATDIVYDGAIGRAANKALVDYLDRPLLPQLNTSLTPIVVVDTQPTAGNCTFDRAATYLAAIDHHPHLDASNGLPFIDIRPMLGATATMVTQYLRAAELVPDAKVATALFYGIKTDTLDLERMATDEDVDAYIYLQPLIDRVGLRQIERAQVSADYFRHAYAALKAASVYDNLLFSYLGQMPYPDLAAEMADWLMRFEGAEWVVCCGQYEKQLYLSVRAHPPLDGAGGLIRAMVTDIGSGGGHQTMAGGQVPLVSDVRPTRLVNQLRRRALRHLNIPEKTSGQKLLKAGF